MKTTINFLLIFVLLNLSIPAQWPSNPAVNLTVCDTTGEQALAKIVSTSDGGCYISWFDTRSGSYAVYLQRFDVTGNKLWAPNGLLVSNNPQDTWITDYDLLADENDNAIIAFSDIRNGGNLNPVVYAISPSGNFLWGNNGIVLNPTSDFQPSPKLAKTNDGNIVVAWIISAARSQVGLQKISPAGVKLWGTNPIILQSATEGLNYPDIVTSDSGGVILFHTATTGNFPAQTVKLRAKKINLSGTVSWDVSIQNIGTIAAFTVPEVYSDNNNGGLIAWHDDRDNNNLQSAFVQRISSSGSLYFPVNGAEASLLANRHKFNPVVAFDNTTNETYVFWMETEPNQNQNGISGQKLSSNGTRQWTDNAKIFKDLSAPNTTSISYLTAEMGNGKAYLFYLEGNASGLNDKVEGFACDGNGNFLWPGNFTVLSNPTSDKLQLVSTVDVYKNCKLAWGDNRLDASGIYAQDINPNGELGNSVVPVELVSFSANISDNSVTLNWVTATELNNSGFEIQRLQNRNIEQSSEWIPSEQNWETIGFVPGFGTTSESHTYSFVDNLTLNHNQTLFYRLKQIDFNGSSTTYNYIEVSIPMPDNFVLYQNHPNPFNPITTISFSLPVEADVTIKLFNMLGQEVAMITDGSFQAGNHQINFNAQNLTSGAYIYTFDASTVNGVRFKSTRKMLLLR